MVKAVDGKLYGELFDPEDLYLNHLVGLSPLSGTETVSPNQVVLDPLNPNVDLTTTFLAEVTPGQVSNGIYILPDMYGHTFDMDKISPEVLVADIALFRVGTVYIDGVFSHYVSDVHEGTTLTDDLLEQNYDHMVDGETLSFHAFDKNIAWQADSTTVDALGTVTETTYFQEIYLIAEMAPFKIDTDLTVEGRALIAVGNPTGQRSDQWGGWIDFIAPGEAEVPTSLEDPAVDELVELMESVDNGSLSENPTLLEEVEGKELTDATNPLLGMGAYASFLEKTGEVGISPKPAYKIYGGAGELTHAKGFLKNVQGGVAALTAGYEAAQVYRKTGSKLEATKAGSVDLAVGLSSGYLGAVAYKGTLFVVGGAAAAVGAPVAGVVIGVAAGAVAGLYVAEWSADFITDRGEDWFPNWWPKPSSSLSLMQAAQGSGDEGAMLQGVSAQAFLEEASNRPAWIFDADTGEMVVSLADTMPDVWQEAVTRVGVSGYYDMEPLDLEVIGDQHIAKNDLLFGGEANDLVIGGLGDDILVGLEGDDILGAGAGDDILEGGPGNDTLFGGPGADVLLGGSGNDVLRGGGGDDSMTGGPGHDKFFGGPGADVLKGGGGDDAIRGNAGNDKLLGGPGADKLFGGGDTDMLMGGGGDDVLRGGGGNDILRGGPGSDRLIGGSGNDRLFGGPGKEVLIGGSGGDKFVYKKTAHIGNGFDSDIIRDFAPGQDVLNLSNVDANTLLGGNQDFTFIGAASFSAAGQLRYSSGVLSGDVNGDGSADFAIRFANSAAVSSDDIIL